MGSTKVYRISGKHLQFFISLLEYFLYSQIIAFYVSLSVKLAYHINHCLSNHHTVNEQLEAFLGMRLFILEGASNLQIPRDPQNNIT